MTDTQKSNSTPEPILMPWEELAQLAAKWKQNGYDGYGTRLITVATLTAEGLQQIARPSRPDRVDDLARNLTERIDRLESDVHRETVPDRDGYALQAIEAALAAVEMDRCRGVGVSDQEVSLRILSAVRSSDSLDVGDV